MEEGGGGRGEEGLRVDRSKVAAIDGLIWDEPSVSIIGIHAKDNGGWKD